MGQGSRIKYSVLHSIFFFVENKKIEYLQSKICYHRVFNTIVWAEYVKLRSDLYQSRGKEHHKHFAKKTRNSSSECQIYCEAVPAFRSNAFPLKDRFAKEEKSKRSNKNKLPKAVFSESPIFFEENKYFDLFYEQSPYSSQWTSWRGQILAAEPDFD